MIFKNTLCCELVEVYQLSYVLEGRWGGGGGIIRRVNWLGGRPI